MGDWRSEVRELRRAGDEVGVARRLLKVHQDPHASADDWAPAYEELAGDAVSLVEALIVRIEALEELEAAIHRGGWDVSPCGHCGEPVVCLPDGLPMCEPCAVKGQGHG